MIPLVEIPEIVQHYESFFLDVFSSESLENFKRYVSGLIVSENKTVEGINRIFVVDTRNQSSLNRFLTKSNFSVEKLNNARLNILFSNSGTEMKNKGVLSIDDTLLEHKGKNFEKIALLFDHAQNRYVWAHNLVNLHYSDDITDYPIAFRLWEPAEIDKLEAGLKKAGIPIRSSKYTLKKDDPKRWKKYLLNLWRRHQTKPKVEELYQSKNAMAKQMLTTFFSNYPEYSLPIAFDKWFTQPAFCRFIDKTLKKPYVGTLKNNEKVVLKSGKKPIAEFAKQLIKEHNEAIKKCDKPIFKKIKIFYKGEKETYYSYCNTHYINNFGKKRLVINYDKPDLSDAPVFFISNRLYWNAPGITRIRRHRWPVEIYHEEGKAEGLNKYQIRDFNAVYKHIALVAVTYSLLKVVQHDKPLLKKLQRDFKTKLDGTQGYWRRNTQAHALWSLVTFISIALSQGQSLKEIMEPILEVVSYRA